MKYYSTLIVTIILSVNSVFAQMTEAEKNELYPEQYTFEKAEDLQVKGEYEKAIWYYINLYPDNKTQVVKIVKAIGTKLDTIDMTIFIKKSFALYGTFDPGITAFKDGVPNMDIGKLKLKGTWGDELIQKISDPNKILHTASEYNLRGLDKAKTGNYKDAIEDFNKAIEIKPTGQVYYNSAYSKSMIKDYKGAIQDYDKTIEFKYRLSEAYFERGYCKDQLNKPEGAIDDYTNAIKINDKYADAYNNRAFTKLKQKNYKGAVKDFDKAIKIKPNFAGAYVNRGFAKKELGKSSEACSDWEKAIELGFKQAQQFIDKYCK